MVAFCPDSLVLHFEGNDGDTTTTDDSVAANSVTVLGTAEIDAAQSKFGLTSLLVQGTGDGVEIPINSDLWQLTNNSSFECFTRFNQIPSVFGQLSSFFQTRRPLVTSEGFALLVNTSDTLQCVVWNSSGTIVLNITGTTAVTTGVWHHLGIKRASDGVVSIWLDGTEENSGTPSGTPAVGFEMTIGHDPTSTGRRLNGWIDEVGINKGSARDLSVVPDSPFCPPPVSSEPVTNRRRAGFFRDYKPNANGILEPVKKLLKPRKRGIILPNNNLSWI